MSDKYFTIKMAQLSSVTDERKCERGEGLLTPFWIGPFSENAYKKDQG